MRRDALGGRLVDDPWFDSAISAPDHEPGYDSFTLIADCNLHIVHADSDSVVVKVTYAVIGKSKTIVATNGLPAGFVVIPMNTTETVLFPVVKTSTRSWRINSPQIDQHVSAMGLVTHSIFKIQPELLSKRVEISERR